MVGVEYRERQQSQDWRRPFEGQLIYYKLSVSLKNELNNRVIYYIADFADPNSSSIWNQEWRSALYMGIQGDLA
jgi:hypothetical protein